MALDVLLQAIAEDGDAEARQILDAARAEADAIRAAADVRAAQRTTDACAAREAELRAELEAQGARTRNEARVQVLLARVRFLDRVFAETEARLPGILEGSAPEALVSLCQEALEFFAPGAARIRCRGALSRKLTGGALGDVAVVADDTVPEGVIVESIDGSSRVDNTLGARLRRRRPELSIALLSAVAGSA